MRAISGHTPESWDYCEDSDSDGFAARDCACDAVVLAAVVAPANLPRAVELPRLPSTAPFLLVRYSRPAFKQINSTPYRFFLGSSHLAENLPRLSA
jgi:hypothetical protein